MIEKSECEPLGLCLLFLFWCDIIEIEPEGTGINRNLSAVPTAVILKLSGSVMRIFQYTGFRKLIAVNQNLYGYSLHKNSSYFFAV